MFGEEGNAVKMFVRPQAWTQWVFMLRWMQTEVCLLTLKLTGVPSRGGATALLTGRDRRRARFLLISRNLEKRLLQMKPIWLSAFIWRDSWEPVWTGGEERQTGFISSVAFSDRLRDAFLPLCSLFSLTYFSCRNRCSLDSHHLPTSLLITAAN